MLASIAILAAGLPLALVAERVILRLSNATPVSDWLRTGPETDAPRVLPWQTAPRRAFLARVFAISLPILLLLTALRFGSPEVFVSAVVVVALVTCCATDLLAYRVPNLVTMPALFIVLTASALLSVPQLLDATLGVAVCGGSMLAVAILTRGGLGGGDVKLVALLGAALGLPDALFALGGGIVAGSLVVIGLHLTRSLQRGDVFPYAPFLSLAGLVVLLT